jgi:hypothetical protein
MAMQPDVLIAERLSFATALESAALGDSLAKVPRLGNETRRGMVPNGFSR